MKNCFKVIKPEIFYNRNIILVDDIVTTGATIEEVMKILKKAEVRNVYAFTITQ